MSAKNSRLLVDIGWPGTLGSMKANLARMGVPLRELRYALATHYHIDHAGLAEEMKREGVPLLVLDVQVDAIPLMKQWTKPQDHYVDITAKGNVVISFEQSRKVLSQLGIAGEILHTPGHSDHCVSLLLDDGSVFTGDLPAEVFAFDDATVLASWRLLRARGATRVYPAHGPICAIDGCGLPDTASIQRAVEAGHFGLASMRERARMIGARLEIQSAQEYGTAVILIYASDQMDWR